MARQGPGVSDIDQSFEELQRVVEFFAGIESADNAKGQQGATHSAQIFLGQRVIGIVGESSIIDPLHPSMIAECSPRR